MKERKTLTLYRMTFADGSFVMGTARILTHASPYSANYIRLLARTGAMASNGCTVAKIIPGAEYREPHRMSTAIYIATNPHEDPIIGPAEEIAALTGYTTRYILNLASSGRISKASWRVRRATEEEAKEAES